MRGARWGAAIGVLLLVSASRAGAQATTDGWVVLPVDEYRDLRTRALASPAPDTPPFAATLTNVEYDLRAAGDTVAGRARLTIDVLRDGWVRVPIPPGLLVREARLDGESVSLVKQPPDPPHVLLPRAGRFLLDLDIVAPLAAGPGSESVALPATAAPIVQARLTMPRRDVDLTVAGGFIVDQSETADEMRWTVLGHANEPLALTWRRRVDDRRAELPLRTRARLTQLVTLGEEAATMAASVRVEVIQGLATDVILAIPSGTIVNQVDGPTVADWEVADGVLRVRLLDASAIDVSFVVHGETRVPRDGPISVPIVRMPSAERESGGVAVDVAGAGQILKQQTRGLDPTDPSTLGDLVAARESPSMVAFRYRPSADRNVALTVDLVRYTPQAVLVANVDEARYRALAAEDGRLLVHARYAVRNNQRSFLKALLPSGGRVWSATVNGRPVHPGAAADGGVLLPLEKGRSGEEAPTFAVEVVYFQTIPSWGDKGEIVIALPALDLPVSRTGVDIRHSPRYDVVLASTAGAFRIARDEGPFTAALRGDTHSMDTVVSPASRTVMDRDAAQLQSLVDRFRVESGTSTVAGTLPVQVVLPDFGLSLFVASELTAETQAASIALAFKRADR